MHGHDADFVAHDVHVALHFRGRRAHERDETLQRGRLGPFVGEREVQEFVERIGGFRAEPRQNLPAAAFAAEEMRIEAERRFAAGELGEALELRGRRRTRRVFGFSQRRPQRAAAAPGQREQLVVVEPEQRALEHGRERKIVAFVEECVGEHQEIHDRDVLGQHQPVGARNRDGGVLERANDRLEQGPALAHQDEDVAGAAALIEQDTDRGRNTLGELRLWIGLGRFVERRVPRLDLGRRRRRDRRPDLDETRRFSWQGDVGGNAVRIAGDARENPRPRKHRIDCAEHV